MVTISVKLYQNVLEHLKKGTGTSDLLNFNIDRPLWPRNQKVAILEAFLSILGPKMAFLWFFGQKGVSI